jgi:hypothetical protein
MSVGWVAASVRGRLLLRRRIGPERIPERLRVAPLLDPYVEKE